MFILSTILTLIALLDLIDCNTEKAIFSAPDAVTLPQDASIENLYLSSLNPKHLSIRTHLNATFPTTSTPKGSETWFLLEELNPGQRYEVRICWLATQPTSFSLYTHDFAKVMEDSDLISSLSSYAYARHNALLEPEVKQLQARHFLAETRSPKISLLLLQVYAAADYFSLNQTLMENVPPVLVDIVLDPYIFNVFPQSLIPTACYIVFIAALAWILSAWISSRLHQITQSKQGPPLETPLKQD